MWIRIEWSFYPNISLSVFQDCFDVQLRCKELMQAKRNTAPVPMLLFTIEVKFLCAFGMFWLHWSNTVLRCGVANPSPTKCDRTTLSNTSTSNGKSKWSFGCLPADRLIVIHAFLNRCCAHGFVLLPGWAWQLREYWFNNQKYRKDRFMCLKPASVMYVLEKVGTPQCSSMSTIWSFDTTWSWTYGWIDRQLGIYIAALGLAVNKLLPEVVVWASVLLTQFDSLYLLGAPTLL